MIWNLFWKSPRPTLHPTDTISTSTYLNLNIVLYEKLSFKNYAKITRFVEHTDTQTIESVPDLKHIFHIVILTYSYSHTDTYILILKYSYSHTHTHIVIFTYWYSHINTHILILTYSHIHIFMITYSHSHTEIIKLTCACTHTHILILTY